MGMSEALGLIETFGLVYVLEAADVDLVGYENTASGYISVLVRGDVGACKAAVKKLGEDGLYSHVVIPSPHRDLAKITALYSLDALLGENETV